MKFPSVAGKCLLLSLLFALFASPFASATTFSDAGFVDELVVSPGGSPMGVTWAPDGRMFVWRKAGVVVVYAKGSTTGKTFLDIHTRVNESTDRGLVGFALDPNFATNGTFYLAYVFEPGTNTTDTGPKTQRVSKFHVKSTDATVGDPASEQVILGKISTAGCSGINQDCIPDDRPEHTIDSLVFYGGKLFVSVGDGASDAVNQNAFRAQNLDSLNGKILRINTDGTAPSDNPFFNGDANANRSKVFDYGLRNPFRMTIDQATGKLYIGDVGQASWEEINTGRGKNFGWPCYEGDGTETQYIGDPKCQALPASAVTKPIKAYPHSEGSCVIGGPLYSGTAYPAQYQGSVFYADFVGGFIKRLTLDASGNVTGTVPFASSVSQPVFLNQGPDGNLYYIAIGAQQVRRIRFVGSGNHAPVAKASANPTNGYAPLTVNFSSAGTTDADGDTLTYSWNFGDGSANSSAANPQHQYAANGKYNAVLTVKDPSGASSTASVLITVGSKPPTAIINQPANGIHVDVGTVVNFSGTATDPDDGTLSGVQLQWDVILHHNTHIHDGVVLTSGNSGSFTVKEHDTTATFYYEVKLTATDSSGLSNSASVFVYPNLPTSSCASPSTAGAVVICSPTSGSNVSSPVHVTAAGGSSVVLMELWRDGTKVSNFTGRSIDTNLTLAAGSHKVTVYGKNSAGSVTASQAVTFTVGSSTTCTPASATSVVICTPANGASVGSSFAVKALGGSSVTFMELWLDSTKPFQNAGNSINTTLSNVSGGSHTLTVYGRNSSGVLDHKSVTITVTGGGSTCTAPSSAGVNVCSPSDGSTVSSPVRALASGTTTGTFARMELWVDGVQKFVTSSRTLDTTITLGSGTHRLAFLAVNTAGTVINRAVNVTVP